MKNGELQKRERQQVPKPAPATSVKIYFGAPQVGGKPVPEHYRRTDVKGKLAAGSPNGWCYVQFSQLTLAKKLTGFALSRNVC